MIVYNKNKPRDWENKLILKYLDEFNEIYKKRPIKNNHGGMSFPHMFGLYFFLKKIKPSFVVESGIFKGQSTWLIENTLPNAKILSLDPNLNFRQYISKSQNVEYSSSDFVDQNFSEVPNNSLVFFDDHQNFYERLLCAYSFGFKHIVADDNYPSLQGDTYSFKKIYSGSGLNDKRIGIKKLIKALLLLTLNNIKKKLNKNLINTIQKYELSIQDIIKTKNHFQNIEKLIEIYFEFPPIFKKKFTRWGDNWDEVNYPTPKPLLSDEQKEQYSDAYKDSGNYTWMCYLKLIE